MKIVFHIRDSNTREVPPERAQGPKTKEPQMNTDEHRLTRMKTRIDF